VTRGSGTFGQPIEGELGRAGGALKRPLVMRDLDVFKGGRFDKRRMDC
jgi:hypothetical protein